MTTNDETIVAKIRKLLALARDKATSVHEAATAAAMAQRLMARHAIDSSMVEEGQDAPAPETFTQRNLVVGRGPMPTWLLELCAGVMAASDLRGAYLSTRQRHEYTAFGPADELEAAEALVTWLASEVARLELEESRRRGAMRASYWTGFRNGAAMTIRHRLAEARREERDAVRREAEGPSSADYAAATQAGDAERLLELDRARAAAPASGYALARVETAIARLEQRPTRIDQWQREQGMKFSRGRGRSLGNVAGYSAGREAGKRASLRPTRAIEAR